MNDLIKVIIADPSEYLRDEIKKRLNEVENINVIACVASGIELIESVTKEVPDVIITDTILAKLDGLSALTAIKNIIPDTKVIVISSFLSQEIANECASVNVNYLILKPFSMQNLIEKTIACTKYQFIKPKTQEYDLDMRIANNILEQGISTHIKGYQYIKYGVFICSNDSSIITAITKQLYPTIAKKFDTTPIRVERAIRHAIETAWVKGDMKIIQENINRKKPTNAEFISFLSEKIRLESTAS